MTEIRIHNPIQTEFAMVPNVLWRWPGLSFKAKAFMAYLLSFRHGVCPPVAAMEAQTGLGRDARKAAMRELQVAGLARWVVQRDGSARIVAKYLEVTTAPLLLATADDVRRDEESRATENPSDGNPVAVRRVSSRLGAENPAILKRDKKEKGAGDAKRRPAASAGLPKSAEKPAQPVALNKFERFQLLTGQSCLVAGELVKPGTPRHSALSALAAVQDAGERDRISGSAA